MAFDIKARAAEASVEDEGTVVHIVGIDEKPEFYKDPDGKTKPTTITVAGVHSAKYRSVERDQRRRKLKPNKLTTASLYEDNMERVVACTLAWEGFELDEKVIQLTPHNARMLYTLCPWVYEQIVEAMNEHMRFFENSSGSPANMPDTEQS